MSLQVSVLESFNAISSYSPLYSVEIDDYVENMCYLSGYNEIMCEVRSCIYNFHWSETVCSYFMSTMSLDEAIEKYEEEYNTEEKYVLYEYFLNIENERKFKETALCVLEIGTSEWQLNNDVIFNIFKYLSD